jgi:hypothetical protein
MTGGEVPALGRRVSGKGVLAVAVFEEDTGHFEGAFGEGIAMGVVECGVAFLGVLGEVYFPSAIGELPGVKI